ncbi:RING finger and CCCH-type zinc finger domain-containing protein roquin [Haematobia irritans]|uniref:RING finger and CCCH-type zinc finger domain-containing protein roquin n=1 Tax=Haematobia irritans TaxID=7368 RepID=UPI003F4F90FE
MPFQAPSWTEFYTCPICENEFSTNQRLPISLGCGHTICRVCLATLYSRQCPFDQTSISTDVDNLPINNALLQLLNSGDGGNDNGNGDGKVNTASTSNANSVTKSSTSNINVNNNHSSKTYGYGNENVAAASDQQMPPSVRNLKPEDLKCYKSSKKCIEELAQYLKSFVTNSGNTLLTRPMLRKLVTLVNCQLMEEEGRIRAVRTARFLGERTVTELLLQHQNPQQLSLCLWAAVRSRGCQFLGPSLQEEVLKLVLQALQNGSALSRKVLVMYVVQRLIDNLLPASKTSIGHVVQLLYRASCFKVSKREGDSSLMQLKEEFRNYEALRREHDAQIVQIATEAGLRIAPDQWSSLLYGNTSHKSHMQSICDTLQTPSSFAQSVQELVLALQRTGDPTNLSNLRPHLKHLATIDPSPESPPPTWQDVEKALDAVRYVVLGLVKFMQYHSNRKVQDYPVPPMNGNGKYKISLCRDLTERRMCPRGPNCTFAHSAEERQRYRAKHRRTGPADKNVVRPHTVAAGSGHLQTLDNMKTDFPTNHNQQQNSVGPPHQMQQGINLSNHIDSSNSPIKMKSSPLRKYSNNDNNGSINIMRPNMIDPNAFVGDLSNTTSPLSMQVPLNALHASPIPPPGHMMGINAQGSIINVPPMHKHPSAYDAMPFGTINYGSGKFMRMPNMGMPLPPNMRPPNIRGPISSNVSTGGGPPGQGMLSPRSSVHNSLNITTVVNPPNLQGTNSNKSSGSPLHKNMYNTTMSGDFFNSPGPPSYFTNSNLETGPGDYPLRMSKTKIQKTQNPSWDAHQHHQPIINPAEYTPNQHHLMYMAPQQPPLHQQNHGRPNPEANVFFDKNSMGEYSSYASNKQKTDFNDSPLNLPDSLIFKGGKNNYLEPPGNPSKDINRMKNKVSMTLNEKPSNFWHSGNNNNERTGNNAHFINVVNSNTNVAAGVNIEPPSLFRDRDNFVRSDSILDDDAATFDVPATSTAALGNKYGPICPMYKGHSSSIPSTAHTNTFVDSWNALISQDNDEHDTTAGKSKNDTDFAVFSLNNDNDPLSIPMEKHASSQPRDCFPDSVLATTGSGSGTAFENFDNMQAALSKLSFMNDSRNDRDQQMDRFNFDLNPLYDILSGNDFRMDIPKNPSINDDLLWNNHHVINNLKQASSINLGLDSFWNDDAKTNVTPPPTQPKTTLIDTNLTITTPQSHPQQRRTSQKYDETEFDINEIVDKVWPSAADDSGIKLD